MSTIDPTATLGTLVAERHERAVVFERLRLDYCCGGAETLSEACASRGLDIETVATLLDASDVDDPVGADAAEESDWRQASLEELCTHIVAVHHARVREELPEIAELLSTTVRVHGESDPVLGDLGKAFDTMRTRLEAHLESEEKQLFPGCLALERGGVRIDDALIEAHEGDHLEVGRELAVLRDLGADYDVGAAHCGTHRRLLEALAAFERDLHRHIHEESNVLFRRVRELIAQR